MSTFRVPTAHQLIMTDTLFNIPDEASQDEVDFESSLEQLESIVAALETDDLGLQEALMRYEEGIRLARACSDALQKAELRVQELSDDDE